MNERWLTGNIEEDLYNDNLLSVGEEVIPLCKKLYSINIDNISLWSDSEFFDEYPTKAEFIDEFMGYKTWRGVGIIREIGKDSEGRNKYKVSGINGYREEQWFCADQLILRQGSVSDESLFLDQYYRLLKHFGYDDLRDDLLSNYGI